MNGLGKIEDTLVLVPYGLQLTFTHPIKTLSISEWSDCGVHRKPRIFFELVTKRIEDFALAMEDIVAFVTYGASIMMIFRRLAPCEF